MSKFKTMPSNVYEAIAENKLYFKKTDGGAEYLCTKAIRNSIVGDIATAIVRLDGGAELVRR